MRGQSLVGLLAYEAKIKPDVKALVDRVTSLTDEDIENAVVPLPWYRDALRQLRAEERAKTIVVTPQEGVNPDPIGRVSYWVDENTFVQVTQRSSIELKTGMPVWFPYSGGVWIDTVFCQNVPTPLTGLPVAVIATKTEYREMIRQRLMGLIP